MLEVWAAVEANYAHLSTQEGGRRLKSKRRRLTHSVVELGT